MKRFTKAAALAATAALAAFLALPAGSAGGAMVPDQSYALASEGTLTVGAQSFPIPVGGTGLTGDWDDVTGVFTGDFTIGPDQIVDFPTVAGPATINLETATSGFSANFDPTTGQVDLTSDITITLGISVAGLQIVCTLGPVSLGPSSANPGGSGFTPTDPPNAWEFTVTDAGFDVPAATCDNAAITPVLNTELGLPTTSTAIELAFASGAIAPPVEPPPPPPGPPAPPPVDPPQVGGAQTGGGAAAGGGELPRTGAATPFLVATGLGLLLAGTWFLRAQAAIRRYSDA